ADDPQVDPTERDTRQGLIRAQCECGGAAFSHACRIPGRRHSRDEQIAGSAPPAPAGLRRVQPGSQDLRAPDARSRAMARVPQWAPNYVRRRQRQSLLRVFCWLLRSPARQACALSLVYWETITADMNY